MLNLPPQSQQPQLLSQVNGTWLSITEARSEVVL
jgi:hypothetical protein